MEKIKKTITILIVLSIIIFICILRFKNLLQNEELKNTQGDRTQDFIKDMSLVDDYSTYFSVEKMLENYVKQIASSNEEAIYSLLDNEYINSKNLTKESVLNKIRNIVKYDENIRIRKMYNQENIENADYYVSCIFEKDNLGEEVYLVLYQDKVNFTYAIAHIDKDTYEKEINRKNNELEEKRISKNEYNKTENIVPTEEEIANKYLIDFIGNALYYPEYAYGLLDEAYKNKRFPTMQDFNLYIEERKEIYNIDGAKDFNEFNSMEEYMLYLASKKDLELAGYQIRYEDNYTRYICIDNYNNYYVFFSTTPFNYTVMLDTYTINMPEFKEKYESATTEEKVGMNIEKIVEALNSRDYEYIYGKLANEFKSNYFKTYADFEKYAKKTFNIGYEVTFNEYKEANNLSTYEITLTREKSSKPITKTIVMKLEEGTDFVISFNVE